VNKSRVGIYPGTFDPITNGHLDIIRRAAKIVDRLIVGVARNDGKGPLFTTDERVEIVRADIARLLERETVARIEVRAFDTLLMKFAESVGASVIIRGLRAVSDFEYEFQMMGMNARLNTEIEYVFLMASDPLPVHLVALRQGDRRARRRRLAFRQQARRRTADRALRGAGQRTIDQTAAASKNSSLGPDRGPRLCRRRPGKKPWMAGSSPAKGPKES